MDKIEFGISQAYGLRLIAVDVSETAKELERRHLCGPASALMLGRGLIAAALLFSKIKNHDERLTFQMKVSGPVKGLITEVNGNGGLRGYTDMKLIDEFDGQDEIETKDLIGDQALLSIIHSNEKGVIYSGQINCDKADIRTATARYFNQSEQVPSAIAFWSDLKNHYINSMKGIMVQKMPGADTEKFVDILERFNRNEVSARLQNASSLKDFADDFKLEDMKIMEEKPLHFACGCSYEKTVNIMNTLSVYELQGILKNEEPQRVTCHFCGEIYKIDPDDISVVMLNKADVKKPA